MLEPSGLYYPNRFARLFLLAMEDVMGKSGLHTILSMAGLETYIDGLPPDTMARQFDFVYLASISDSLESMYGARGGRGIALRIGRATFSMGLKDFGALAGMSSPAFQALPLEKRIKIGSNAIGAVFSQFTDQHTEVEEFDTHFLFHVENSPFAWGRAADRPVCHALSGLIQEGLRWSSHSYEFVVHETACRATGSEKCVFKANKNPIGGATLG